MTARASAAPRAVSDEEPTLRTVMDSLAELHTKVDGMAKLQLDTANEVLQIRQHVMRDVDRLGGRVKVLEGGKPKSRPKGVRR